MRVSLLIAISLLVVGCVTSKVESSDTESASKAPKSADRPKATVRAKGINPAKVRASDPDWQFARKEIDASQDELESKVETMGVKGLRQYVLHRGPSARNEVALTFDDGPHPSYTPKLLDILKQAKVKSTFFVIGFMAEKYPDLVKQIAAAGHEVGNHTYSHVTLTKLADPEVLTELAANDDVIAKLTGKRVRYCRPPGGDFAAKTLELAGSLGLTTVLWTDDPGDYANPGDTVLMEREMRSLRPGGIILLHDGSQDTLDTLASLIQAVEAKGLKFVSLDELRKP